MKQSLLIYYVLLELSLIVKTAYSHDYASIDICVRDLVNTDDNVVDDALITFTHTFERYLLNVEGIEPDIVDSRYLIFLKNNSRDKITSPIYQYDIDAILINQETCEELEHVSINGQINDSEFCTYTQTSLIVTRVFCEPGFDPVQILISDLYEELIKPYPTLIAKIKDHLKLEKPLPAFYNYKDPKYHPIAPESIIINFKPIPAYYVPDDTIKLSAVTQEFNGVPLNNFDITIKIKVGPKGALLHSEGIYGDKITIPTDKEGNLKLDLITPPELSATDIVIEIFKKSKCSNSYLLYKQLIIQGPERWEGNLFIQINDGAVTNADCVPCESSPFAIDYQIELFFKIVIFWDYAVDYLLKKEFDLSKAMIKQIKQNPQYKQSIPYLLKLSTLGHKGIVEGKGNAKPCLNKFIFLGDEFRLSSVYMNPLGNIDIKGFGSAEKGTIYLDFNFPLEFITYDLHTPDGMLQKRVSNCLAFDLKNITEFIYNENNNELKIYDLKINLDDSELTQSGTALFRTLSMVEDCVFQKGYYKVKMKRIVLP